MGPIDADPGSRRRRPSRSRAPWQRLAALGIVPAALAALVVHLGGSGAAPTPAAAAAPARAVAGAINLRLADLPGFRLDSGIAGASVSGDPAAQFTRCFGATPSAALGDAAAVSSPNFVTGSGLQSLSVGSAVSVVSPSTLAGDAALAASPRFPQCVADALAAMTWTTTHGVRIRAGNPLAARLPIPINALGTVTPILGMRASMTLSATGRGFPIYLDVYVVGVGHDELTLFAVAGSQVDSAGYEWRLVALLVSRALAQPH